MPNFVIIGLTPFPLLYVYMETYYITISQTQSDDYFSDVCARKINKKCVFSFILLRTYFFIYIYIHTRFVQ